jgi:hypothetical protein
LVLAKCKRYAHWPFFRTSGMETILNKIQQWTTKKMLHRLRFGSLPSERFDLWFSMSHLPIRKTSGYVFRKTLF